MKCTCCFQDKDWEVLERVLVNLPLLLQNKTLILSATHDLINSLCHQLCAMVRQNNRCHYKNLYFRLIQLHFIIKLVHFIFLGLHYDSHFVHPSSFYSFFCSSVFNELNKSGYYNICKFKIYFHNVFWGFQSLLFIDRNIKNEFYPIFIQVNDRQLNFPEKLHGTPSGKFTRSDFHTFVFPVLASMVSYHKYLDRNRAVSEGRGRGMCFCSKLSFVEMISL